MPPSEVSSEILGREMSGTLEDDLSVHLGGCYAFVHLAAYGVGLAEASWEACFRWNVIARLRLWRLWLAAVESRG